MRTPPPLISQPLTATLGRLAVGEGEEKLDLSARVGRPEGPGWGPASDLISDHEFLEEMIDRIERGCGVRNRAYVGTSLLRGYLWRILTTAVAAFLLERRLPDLRSENVFLRFGEGGFAEELAFAAPRFFALPDDPQAGHPDATILPSEEDLLVHMRESLAETHLQELIPALRSLRVRRGTRVLWGVGVDGFAEAFMSVGQGAGREAEALAFAEKLLSGPSLLSGSTNYLVLEHEGGPTPTRTRNTCCLHYKASGEPCITCPRTTNKERRERLGAM